MQKHNNAKGKRKLDIDFLDSPVFPTKSTKPQLQFSKPAKKDNNNIENNNKSKHDDDDDFLNTPALSLQTKTTIKIGGDISPSSKTNNNKTTPEKINNSKNSTLRRTSSEGDDFLYSDTFGKSKSNNTTTLKENKNTTPNISPNKITPNHKNKNNKGENDDELGEIEKRGKLKFQLEKEIVNILPHLSGVVAGIYYILFYHIYIFIF